MLLIFLRSVDSIYYVDSDWIELDVSEFDESESGTSYAIIKLCNFNIKKL